MSVASKSGILLMVAALFLSVVPGASAADVVRIGLSVPNDSFYAPLYAAKDLGYYKTANLDVQITAYRGGAVAQEALTAGAADIITYFAPGVGLAVSKGVKERIVGTIDAAPYGWHLLVKSSSPYKKVADLAGKKIGITLKASTSDMLALWAADRAGVSVATVPLGGGMVPALRGGQVDAIVIFPSPSLELVASGAARSLLDFGKEMEPTLPDVFVASQEMIDKHPEQLRAALSGFYKALAYMRQNRAWALAYLKTFTKEDNDKVNAIVYDVGTLQQSTDGSLKPEWIAASLHIAAKMWKMPDLAKVDPATIYSDKFFPYSTR